MIERIPHSDSARCSDLGRHGPTRSDTRASLLATEENKQLDVWAALVRVGAASSPLVTAKDGYPQSLFSKKGWRWSRKRCHRVHRIFKSGLFSITQMAVYITRMDKLCTHKTNRGISGPTVLICRGADIEHLPLHPSGEGGPIEMQQPAALIAFPRRHAGEVPDQALAPAAAHARRMPHAARIPPPCTPPTQKHSLCAAVGLCVAGMGRRTMRNAARRHGSRVPARKRGTAGRFYRSPPPSPRKRGAHPPPSPRHRSRRYVKNAPRAPEPSLLKALNAQTSPLRPPHLFVTMPTGRHH
ncbi:hypothetical protein SKAU_G00334590 [Synaphobranchus kaupii]|uniref:Uncharacterized protein n=1 Tax=Synaphobranchus kaupii TaxID=118154 RepID=A0A9Q1ELU6_SYNKA|nr:hypothetical protein SKAU_G00334590 [Synaphobranchus kaupii]